MSEFQDQDFEKKLSNAMRRVNAPDDLAKYLMAATEVRAERHLPRSERKNRWTWLMPNANAWFGTAVAAMLLLIAFTGIQVHQRHERRERAEQQFETATRITDQALEHTREQLQRAGVPLD
jgi:hypothetical protein